MVESIKEAKIHRKLAAFLALMIAAQAAGSLARTAVFAGLILWAARGAVCALQAVSLAAVVIFTNSKIAAESPYIFQLRWVLLAVALLRIIIDYSARYRRIPKISAPFFVFVVTALISGYAVSAAYIITVFKILIFVVGVLIGVLGFSPKVREYDWASWFYTLFVSILFLSLPLLFFNIGYDKTGRLFQGILSHPQAFGIFIAPFAVWTLVAYLRNRGRKALLLLFLVAVVVLIISKARTSMLAFSLGATVTFLSGLRNKEIGKLFRSKRFVLLTVTAIFIGTVGLLAAQKRITDGVMDYLVKGYQSRSPADGDELWKSVERSRGGQIERSLNNFAWNPMLGVGFGMTDRYGITTRGSVSFLGIPLSTESEMGFIFLAVPSQTGIVGSVLFLIFLFYLYRPIIEFGDPGWVALSTTAFFVNFGETVLFSSGGLGAFSWLLISYAHLQSVERRRLFLTPRLED